MNAVGCPLAPRLRLRCSVRLLIRLPNWPAAWWTGPRIRGLGPGPVIVYYVGRFTLLIEVDLRKRAFMADRTIDAPTLREWLADGAELAVLDIRPADEVGYVSPLVIANLPAGDVLAGIDRFVPRKQVRTVLADGGDGVAVQLAAALAEGGRSQTYALDGGIPAWAGQGDGLPVFAVNPTAFSDIIQADRDTPG